MTDEIVDKILGVTGATSGILAYIFYRVYKNRTDTASKMKGQTVWQADQDLHDHLSSIDGNCLAYAAVEGTVVSVGRTLGSRHGEEKGVMLKSELIEHKTKKLNGFWTDEKKPLRTSVQVVPFALSKTDGHSNNKIEVFDANVASHIEDDLEVTHDVFTPRQTGAFQAGLDRLVGDVTKGIQETEKMLLTGTSLMGVGKVVLERGEMKLSAPDDSKHPFILTKMRLNELVRFYESSSKTFKILAISFGIVSSALLAGLIWRHLKTWLEERKSRQEFEEIRSAVRARPPVINNAANGEGNGERRESEMCVVCLGNERQVITLNCGHISMCADCAEALPSPKKCPVCRASVERFLPVYHP